jgi:hypothetical protein
MYNDCNLTMPDTLDIDSDINDELRSTKEEPQHTQHVVQWTI